jgi:hypothetical protein
VAVAREDCPFSVLKADWSTLSVQPPSAQLLHQLQGFHDRLREMALFNEAHCLGVALRSPTMCDAPYITNYLLQAVVEARRCGFFDEADWIGSCIPPTACIEPLSGRSPGSLLIFRRKDDHTSEKPKKKICV